MSQTFTALSSAVPGGDTGTTLASKLNDWRDAVLSMHSGSSRPSYATAGTMWRDTTTTPWVLKLYDGSSDISMFDIDPTTHAIIKSYIPGASAAKVLAGVVTNELITPAGLQSRVASIAQYRARTAGYILSADVVADALDVVALTDAATIALDCSTFINGEVTLGGNRIIGNPTNLDVGWGGYIAFTQGAPGSHVPTFGSHWKYAGGIAPTFSTASGAVDYLFYQKLATDFVFCNLANAVA